MRHTMASLRKRVVLGLTLQKLSDENRRVPYGMYKPLAKELGLSVHYVRRFAEDRGYYVAVSRFVVAEARGMADATGALPTGAMRELAQKYGVSSGAVSQAIRKAGMCGTPGNRKPVPWSVTPADQLALIEAAMAKVRA
jgi:hypothetical protein